VLSFEEYQLAIYINFLYPPEKQLGEQCSVLMDCTSQTDNSACTGGWCVCGTGYYDSNGGTTGGTCQMSKAWEILLEFSLIILRIVHIGSRTKYLELK